MKKRTFAIALAAALMLSSCAAPQKQTAETTTAATVTTAAPTATTTATTSITTTTTPEITQPPKPEFTPDCKARIERFAISDKNPTMLSPVEYTIDNENFTVSANITYDNYADIYTLQNCITDISVTGGEYYFSEGALTESGSTDLTKLSYIVVTDKDGLKQKYAVTTSRTVYKLPIVNIYLDGMKDKSAIDRYAYSDMTFSVDCTGAQGFESIPSVSGRIRGRGHSTWGWEKKPYKIKLDEAASVLGLDKDKDWVLLANYSDKSLMRNTVACRLSNTLDSFAWSPTQYPVDLFINGVYCGVYSFGEQPEIAKDRVNVQKDSPDADTGFLLEVGGSEDDDVLGVDFFHTDNRLVNFITFKGPDAEEVTEAQKDFIKDYMNKAEQAILAGKGYEEYIDTKSFCDWIIIHELTYNTDSCFRRSCYINKDKGGKLKMGPVWDFDLAFGNCNVDNQDYNDWVTVGETYEDAYETVNWCNYLMENEAFRAQLRERWSEVRDSLVSEALNCIDHYSELLNAGSQQQNFRVWQIWGRKVGYQSWRNANYETFEEQVQYLKDFITTRAGWIDENI